MRLNYGLKEVLMLGRIHKKGGGAPNIVWALILGRMVQRVGLVVTEPDV